MGGPDGGCGIEQHDVILQLRPVLRVLHGELQQLVLIAGDHRLGPHAGLEELVEQVGGGRLHIAQLFEDGLQAGKHGLHTVRIRHPAAQHIGQ